MDLKEKLISSFMAFEDQVNVNDAVHDIRSAAIKHFELEGVSHQKKQEAWKYTSLNNLQKD